MRILVFGGTAFLSEQVVATAVARGHEVISVSRGVSGTPPEEAISIRFDRSQQDAAALRDRLGRVDVVIDVARQPPWVRSAVAAFPDAHWVFVSTISVYDDPQPGDDATAPLLEPLDEDADLGESPEAYGPLKVACERLVKAGARSAEVIRPGLLVGPGDRSGRFGYWVRRLARGGRVLTSRGNAPTQVLDVRDLARWLVEAAERRSTGYCDAVGPVLTHDRLFEEILAALAEQGAAAARIEWVEADDESLLAHDVRPWMGPRSLPLWIPGDAAAALVRDAEPGRRAGLHTRPIAETARDTWLWSGLDEAVTGLTPDEEAGVLADLA